MFLSRYAKLIFLALPIYCLTIIRHPRISTGFSRKKMKLCPPPLARALAFLVLVGIPSDSSGASPLHNETLHSGISKQQCRGCDDESLQLQFLYAHNAVRAAKRELPVAWDVQLESYARWWAGQRRSDCALEHSFEEGDFRLGENIFWGGGSGWTASDAVGAWAGEERYYQYGSNTCEGGHECRHYTQIVWRSTRRVGCSGVVCDGSDVFMTCNYYPPGNYVGERPY
ncbi:pathogenesis-related protein PR-1-like [Syzygium oleosum]|uniref:pathogenesis-related protein PR-1-like n=1 Tax=Syzygium oleosum TaxID=219896 RepID=UPI0024BBD14F|nr:pathogenesis-related protein PR-1-like [Syzygium oleosum]